MSQVYVSLGGSSQIEFYCQTTEAYPDGEIFAVFDEEDIAMSLWFGPNGTSIELDNPILRKVAKKLEESV
jgi:hypothetical protein